MSKANVAHETLVRAREADRKREADLRIKARQQRRVKEKIIEANSQVLKLQTLRAHNASSKATILFLRSHKSNINQSR